jgi:hypothetical protein
VNKTNGKINGVIAAMEMETPPCYIDTPELSDGYVDLAQEINSSLPYSRDIMRPYVEVVDALAATSCQA